MSVKYAENYTIHHRAVPLPPGNWPGQGRDGCGKTITTPYTAKFKGDWRYYQIYATYISNAASFWIQRKGEILHITDFDISEVKPHGEA